MRPVRLILASMALCCLTPVISRALEHPISANALNPTGRAINMPVPLRYGDRILGDVVITIDQHDQLLIAATDIAPLLHGHLPEPTLQTLQSFGPAPLPLVLFGELDGLNIGFSPQNMELTVSLPADKTKPQALSFARPAPLPSLMEPATVSAFLNYDFIVSQDWTFEDASGVSLNLEGAIRMVGLVLEAEGTVGGSLNGFLCPIEAQCRTQDESYLNRLGTRAVYDVPDWDIRSIAGDTTYFGPAGQRPMDLLGLSLEHNPELFGKPRNRSTRSFGQLLVIDAPADLTISVNGIPMQRLSVQPGSYSLHDLPITLGASTVEVIVTYANGETDIIRFDTLSAYHMLDADQFTWGMTGGLPATWIDGQREYLKNFQGGLHLRHGATDTLTNYFTVQTDSTIHTAGLGFQRLTAWGTFHLGGSVSQGPEIGYAATASFETLPHAEKYSSFRFAADYYSDTYREPGDAQLLASDVLYPAFDSWLRLSAVQTTPLPWNAYATGTARYDFAADTANIPGAVSTGTDRWSVDLGVSRQFFDTTTLTFNAGYGNDRLLSFSHLNDEPELRFGLSLYARFGDSSVGGRHSFGNNHSAITATHLVKNPSDSWQTSTSADNTPERGLYSTVSTDYLGQRGETRLSHTFQHPQGRDEHHQTQFQQSGALGFADGKLAIGAPVRNGFAIVSPHHTIADAEVIIGNPENPRATGSSWMPAIITDLPAHASIQFPLDATGIPDGYALGSSHMTVKAPYKAGYAITLGSDLPLTAYGTLLDSSGTPLSLQSGKATSETYPGEAIDVFTNSSGKFAAEGLGPGRWAIAINTYVYDFSIPANTHGLFHADTLWPEGANQEEPPAPWSATILTESLSHDLP